MNFNHIEYLPFVIIFLLIFNFLYLRNDKKFFNFIRNHWFLRRTKLNKIASLLYLLGFSLLAISLLDLRGPEERRKSKVVDQKTVMLIDTSASMLVEDVRPNRFQKSLLLARHFIKKAAGHSISVILFSDTTKRLVPFTNDTDLLDGRISGLKDIDLNRGGTGLSKAIAEAAQYLLGKESEVGGNILIFTDAEENELPMELELPKSITVAAVGVGTNKGGAIPRRNDRGDFLGYKKHNGQEVISRLDEATLKKLADQIPRYQYWIATSYALPTEKILDFFNNTHSAKISENDMVIKPVLMEWIMVPAIVLFSISLLIKNIQPLIYGFILMISLLNNEPAFAQEDEKNPSPIEKAMADPQVQQYLKKFKDGEITKSEKLKLAEKFLNYQAGDYAAQLYREQLSGEEVSEKNIEAMINFGTSQIQAKDFYSGLSKYQEISQYLKDNPSDRNNELLKKVRQNTLKAIQQQEEDQKQQEKEQQQQEKNDKDQKSDSEQSEEQKSEEQQKKDQQEQEQKEKKNKKKSDAKEDQPQDLKNKPDQPQKRLPKEKLPALLKQLMNSDRELQKKLLDTSTHERGDSGKKDW